MTTTQRGKTARAILNAAKTSLLEVGYAKLSTRTIADEAAVPLSQIHHHFGSKQNLILAVLERENECLLDRQERMYGGRHAALETVGTGMRLLRRRLGFGIRQRTVEMVAAGWSTPRSPRWTSTRPTLTRSPR